MPTIPIRWSDNTKELRENLRQGLDQIEATRAGAEKMAKALGGENLIRAAHNYVAAVQEVGGANKLTAEWQERVNKTVSKAIQQYEAMGKSAPTALTDLAKATQDAGKSTESWTSWLGKANTLLGGLGIGLSVGAVVSFGKALLADADALTKMADRTGISTTGLQRLQVAGDDAGNTIEDMTGAINQMQNRMASGDKSLAGAFAKLNLDLAQLKNLAPDQQFIAISDALRDVNDPAQQVALAMDIFGKQGASVLPTLKRGFDDVRDSAVGMSEDTVKALDDAGDALSRWYRQGKAAAAEATVDMMRFAQAGFNFQTMIAQSMERQAQQTAEQLKKMADAAKSPTLFSQKPATSFALPGDADMKAFERDMADRQKQLAENAAEARRAAEDFARLAVAIRELNTANASGFVKSPGYDPAKGELPGLAKLKADIASAPLQGLNNELAKTGAILNPLVSKSLPQFTVGLRAAGKEAGDLARPVSELGKHIHQAFDGVAAILSNISGKFAEAGAIAARTTTAIMDSLKSGNWIGAISAGVTGAISLIGKLFTSAEKQVNPVRQAFIDAAGGLATLNQRAAEAGVTLRAVLDAKNPKQYEAAIRDLNAALQFQDQAMATLDATVQKYGFSLAQLGPTLSRQKLDEKAKELYQDFKVLTTAGIDVDTVLGQMGTSINAFIADALRTGTEIPAAMKPMLERMAEMGTLTDENGNVITDLEHSGIHFAQTMTEGFKSIVDEVKKLTDAISRGLGLAIQNIPDPEVTGHVSWKVDQVPGSNASMPEYDMPRDNDPVPVSRGGMVNDSGVSYFARGYMPQLPRFTPIGTDTIPAMLTPSEMVLTADQQHAVGALLAMGGSRSGGQAASSSAPDVRQPVYLQVVTPDGRVIQEQFIENIIHNKRGVGTVLRRVLNP